MVQKKVDHLKKIKKKIKRKRENNVDIETKNTSACIKEKNYCGEDEKEKK